MTPVEAGPIPSPVDADKVLHICSTACRHDPAVQRQRRNDIDVRVIDFHAHIVSPEVEALVAGTPQKAAEAELMKRMQGEASVRHTEEFTKPGSARRMTTVAERLGDMDRMGIDLQVLSPSGVQYYYWAEEGLAEQIVRVQNENVARHCADHPDRLRGLGTIALQHPGLAVEQLRQAVRGLGLHGVVVSSLVGGKDLSHPDFEPFWHAASELGCIVFLHPLGTSLGERLNTSFLSNLVGQPLETAVALSKLIFDGVLDRHSGFKLVAAHGGGYLPSYIGRSDHGHAVRPEAGLPKRPPSEYLKQIWFDTVVYAPEVVRHLIDTVGVSQLVLGTDYPYDMGMYDVHDFIASVPNITLQERRLIMGLNADALLRATAPHP